MTYNIRIATAQNLVWRGPIASYRHHKLIIVGYLRQCPHVQRAAAHYLDIGARPSEHCTMRMTEPFRLHAALGDDVRVNVTVDLHVSCQQYTFLSTLFTKTTRYTVCIGLSDTASWLDDISDLYLDATLTILKKIIRGFLQYLNK